MLSPAAFEWVSLDPRSDGTAIQDVSLQAYRREARLLQRDDFPPLRETLDSIQTSPHYFRGVKCNGSILGLLEVEVRMALKSGLIHRLVVADDYLRRGVASYMLESLIVEFAGIDWEVETAVANYPATALYHSLGFSEQSSRTTDDGFQLVVLSRASR